MSNVKHFFQQLKKRQTQNRKNNILSSKKQMIFNMVFCDNALIQNDIKEKITSSNNIEMFQQTILRILKRLGITEKMLSLVSIERNSDKHIDARAIYSMEMSCILNEILIFFNKQYIIGTR